MTYVIIDTETTGLRIKNSELIELSAIRIKDGKPERKAFDKVIKPSIGYIPPDIETLTGITTEMIKNAPVIEDVIDDFIAFVGDDPIVGWNVEFDKRFIEKVSNKPLSNTYDVIPYIKDKYPDLNNYKQITVARHLNIPIKDAHRAISDCIILYQIITKTWGSK